MWTNSFSRRAESVRDTEQSGLANVGTGTESASTRSNKMSEKTNHDLDQLCINAIRVLSLDMSEKARSGHPGLPLGAAPMAYTLWDRFLRHHPLNPRWFNRD